jgi:hypothetical protein
VQVPHRGGASLAPNVAFNASAQVGPRHTWLSDAPVPALDLDIALNAPNTPHFNNPSGSLGSANFGQITGASGERSLRFGLKLTF